MQLTHTHKHPINGLKKNVSTWKCTMHEIFFSPYIFFAIRDSHIADIKLKNKFRNYMRIWPLSRRRTGKKSLASSRKNGTHTCIPYTCTQTRDRLEKKVHTYRLHAARKGCTQSHKIPSQTQFHPHVNMLPSVWTWRRVEPYTWTLTHWNHRRKLSMCWKNAFLATLREEFHSEYLAVKTARSQIF